MRKIQTTQLQLLAVVYRAGTIDSSSLETRLGVTRDSVLHRVRYLRNRGLLEVNRGNRGRHEEQTYRVTDAARDLLRDRADRLHDLTTHEYVDQLLADLDAAVAAR